MVIFDNHIIPANGYTQFELLQIASSIETRSEHPIAQAIVKKASEKSIPKLDESEFYSISGQGVLASYQEKRIFVGSTKQTKKNDGGDDSLDFNNQAGAIPQDFQTKITELETQGRTVVAVFVEYKLAGLIAIADTLRVNAKYIIDEIKKMKKEVILITGDNDRTANAIAAKLGITKVMSQVSPETKALEIKQLQNQDRKVIMIGDGINDAPALTQADAGIAIGSGSDIAISARHIILMKSDLYHILYALKLGQYSLRKIKQNLAISFTYNVITISIAAGLLYGITNSLILTPALAALGWVISDSLLFGNSLLIRKFSR